MIIPLTQNKFAIVDAADFESLNRYKWYAATISRVTYAVRQTKNGESQRTIRMHRQLLGVLEAVDVHHINGDGLDNRRSNLLVCTQRQNSQGHCRKRIKASSRFRGVCWCKALKKWQGYIRLKSGLKHLGFFVEETDAARAYDIAARKYFGEFAAPNFP